MFRLSLSGILRDFVKVQDRLEAFAVKEERKAERLFNRITKHQSKHQEATSNVTVARKTAANIGKLIARP